MDLAVVFFKTVGGISFVSFFKSTYFIIGSLVLFNKMVSFKAGTIVSLDAAGGISLARKSSFCRNRWLDDVSH